MIQHQPSHPQTCAVFGCTRRACFGFAQDRKNPAAGLWVCSSALHRAWAFGMLAAHAERAKATTAPHAPVGPKPAAPKPASLFDEVAA